MSSVVERFNRAAIGLGRRDWLWAAGFLLVACAALIGATLPRVSLCAVDERDPAGAVVRGLLGGTRQAAANGLWIRGYAYWEARDAAGMEHAHLWALRLAPENTFFWINAARMLAYDVRHWEARDRVLQMVDHPEAPARAIHLLALAEEVFPASADIPIERGLVLLNVVGDVPAAADAFGVAARRPGAPFFAGRLHGELLRAAGEPAAAYRFYRAIYPDLPAENPAAAKATIRARIRALEAELGITEPMLPSESRTGHD